MTVHDFQEFAYASHLGVCQTVKNIVDHLAWGYIWAETETYITDSRSVVNVVAHNSCISLPHPIPILVHHQQHLHTTEPPLVQNGMMYVAGITRHST